MDFFSFQEKIKKPSAPSAPQPSRQPRDVMTVSQLASQITSSIQKLFPSILNVQGEVSNCQLNRASGILYFDLKDQANCIRCVMYSSDVQRLAFMPKDGMEVVASGRVMVYASRSQYQLKLVRLSPIGQGALELAFRQLKEKLEREGLFADDRKKPLPPYPSRIVLVTSPQAAGAKDMLKVLRRFPWLSVMFYPVPVQGEGAAERIADALADLNRNAAKLGIDLLLLGRGGGSLEDLWEFNQELLARAIVASRIPIITGIGHDVDVTIADLAADYHAHTPTEAAQIATGQWRNARPHLESLDARLKREFRRSFDDLRRRLETVKRHEIFRRPLERINASRQRLDDRQRALTFAVSNRIRNTAHRLTRISARLAAHHPRHTLALARQHQTVLSQRLRRALDQLITHRRSQLEALHGQLNALSPLEVLRRGYSITTLKKTGQILRDPSQVKRGDRILTRLADGTTESTISDTAPPNPQLPLFDL
jgi:exodeoxyribonuclease VII large subunit